MRRLIGLALGAAFALAARAAERENPNAIRPGEVELEAPTVVCLGVRWPYEGDADRDARAGIWYRKAGEEGWCEGLPLHRVRPEYVAGGKKVPRMFAGSLFDLAPGTAYELRLKLVDPDGGGTELTVRAATRPVPRISADANVRVLPEGVHGGGIRPTNGRPGRWAVLRGADGKKTIIDAKGGNAIEASGSRYAWVENLTIRNAVHGVKATGSVGLVVRNCRFENCEFAVRFTDQPERSRDSYIADNVMVGPCKWPSPGKIEGQEAIEVVGTGHVVCYNRISGWGDGISIRGAGGRAVDFYGNDLSECTDDAIEMDYGLSNVRCFRNRMTNCRMGVSTQPVYGGPCYVFRNVMFNLEHTPFKMHNSPSGILMFHNTSVRAGRAVLVYSGAPVYDAVFRNNVFLGSRGGVDWTSKAIDCDLGNDACSGGGWPSSRGGRRFPVSKSDFLVPFEFPKSSAETCKPMDFRLAPASRLIDKGVRLPTINDGFKGAAPDLGACEYGAEPPHYGPRPPGMDESTAVAARLKPKTKAPTESVWDLVARKEAAVRAGAGGPIDAHAEVVERARKEAEAGDFEAASEAMNAAAAGAKIEEEKAALAEIAQGFLDTSELRRWIIEGAEDGVKKSVTVDFMGKPARGKVASAGEDGLTVKLLGSEFRLTWDKLRPRRLYGLAKKYAADEGGDIEPERQAALERFAAAHGIEVGP